MQNLHRIHTPKSLAVALLKLSIYQAWHIHHQQQSQRAPGCHQCSFLAQQLPEEDLCRWHSLGESLWDYAAPTGNTQTGRSLKASDQGNVPARNSRPISRIANPWEQLTGTACGRGCRGCNGSGEGSWEPHSRSTEPEQSEPSADCRQRTVSTHVQAVAQRFWSSLSTGHTGGHTQKLPWRHSTCPWSPRVFPRRVRESQPLNCAAVTNGCHHLYSSFNSQAWLIETTNRRAKKTLINQHCFLDLSSLLQRVRAVK